MIQRINTMLIIAFIVFVAGGWSLLLAGESRSGEAAAAADKPIRLHIIANSDSATDQQIKYQVRDAVTAYLTPHLADAPSAEAARQIVAARREEIVAVARHTVAAAGVAYPVALETGIFEFPLRSYGTVILPPGRYEAVRILLGEASGKNWWCVIFPPLCFIDATQAVAVPAVAGPASKTADPRPDRVELRWKVAELWQNAGH